MGTTPKQQIKEALVRRAVEVGEPITYGAFARQLGLPDARSWTTVLDEICIEEEAAGRPDITVLLVNQETYWPSQIGFRGAKPKPTGSQWAEAEQKLEDVIAYYYHDKANRPDPIFGRKPTV